jgi:hypothetical protein
MINNATRISKLINYWTQEKTTRYGVGNLGPHLRQVYACVYLKSDNKNTMVMVKVLNVNFNNISVISWRSALLVEETEVPRFQFVLEYSDIQV